MRSACALPPIPHPRREADARRQGATANGSRSSTRLDARSKPRLRRSPPRPRAPSPATLPRLHERHPVRPIGIALERRRTVGELETTPHPRPVHIHHALRRPDPVVLRPFSFTYFPSTIAVRHSTREKLIRHTSPGRGGQCPFVHSRSDSHGQAIVTDHPRSSSRGSFSVPSTLTPTHNPRSCRAVRARLRGRGREDVDPRASRGRSPPVPGSPHGRRRDRGTLRSRCRGRSPRRVE